MKRTFFIRGGLLVCFVVLLCGVHSADARDPDPDHTIWIQLESEPTGATIYALPKDEMAEPTIQIGRTPYTIAVDLSWKHGVFWKNWNRLVVSSPGNICRAVRQQDKNYDIVLSFLAVRGGYTDKRIQQRALVLKHPGKAWEGKRAWPRKAIVKVQLDRQRQSANRHTKEKQRARKVIIANNEQTTGDDGSSGTLKVRANLPGARIYVDKRYVGDVPMQVIMKDGPHNIEVRKRGFHPASRAIYMTDGAEITYDARLLPLNP